MVDKRKLFTLFSAASVGLVAGTLYLFSTYGPQLAHRLSYSGTETSLIAFCGSIGISLSGIPAGMLIDSKGSSKALVVGAVFISSGYIGLKSQFDQKASNVHISALLSFLIGIGSTFINSAMIKCAALLYPDNRGVATSFPVASYGLSAFAYSFIGNLLYGANTSKFLGLLGYSTIVVTIIGLPSIYMADKDAKAAAGAVSTIGSGRHTPSQSIELDTMSPRQFHEPETPLNRKVLERKLHGHQFSKMEVVKSSRFWILLSILGILAGLGQLYIYSVGFMIKSLLHGGADDDIQAAQSFQVSLISIFNCAGRLLCGAFGDLLVNKYEQQRSWIVFVPVIVLLIVQVFCFCVTTYDNLWLASLLNGLGYGFTWSCIPQLLLEYFGVNVFSFAWGFISMGTILPTFFFTHLFGSNYDNNLVTDESSGTRVCLKGHDCYDETFLVSSAFAFVAILLVIWINARPYIQRKYYDQVSA
uniref:MFS transporter n=1 Tax=Cyberlindnera americana TaxID=36016 RepID=A0A5P8N8H5_9ASCO|nr:MFS transporter [Cyberlindnera americana]